MASLSVDQKKAFIDKYISYHAEADRRNEWTFFVDEIYAPECVYTCEYAGVILVEARGTDQIKATHYGRDMQHGWEDWTFPYKGFYVGEGNEIITHWMNRGPGLREDGSYRETPGVSFLTLNDSCQIVRQFDMFDLAHQMKLCDELEDAGLLSPALKENWVIPMKQKLIAQLQRNMK